MSIINDALKKAQEKLHKQNAEKKKSSSVNPNKQKSETPQHPSPTTSQPIPTQSTQPIKKDTTVKTEASSSSKKNYIPIIGFFIVGVVLLGVLWYFLNQNKEPVEDTIAQDPIMFSGGSIVSANDKSSLKSKKKFGRNEFVLSGTMEMGPKKAAIINNEVYQIGDNINGMSVVDIRAKEVDLMKNGKIATISVK